MSPSKTKRRDQGAGALFYDASSGLWTARVELPTGPNGKRRRKTIRSKSKATAAEKLKALNAEVARTGNLPTASPTVATWMPQWLDRRATKLKPRTLDTYRGYSERYIVPILGRTRLDRLSPAHVQLLHDEIVKQGLSSTTALQAHRILTVALRDAFRAGLVTKNVADKEHVDAPTRATNVRPALTAAEAKAVLRAAGDSDLAVHWTLALLAGLRQGERLGLTWDSVDLDAGVLTVQWQVQRLTWTHGCGGKCGKVRGGSCPERRVTIPPDQEAQQLHGGLWLTRPKSRSGWREVPILEPVAAVLARHREQTPAGANGLVLHRAGLPIDPARDSEVWHDTLTTAGVRQVPLHSARHTCATLLADLGIPEDVRMGILGHSSATVTRGYTHATDARARAAMDALTRLLIES